MKRIFFAPLLFAACSNGAETQPADVLPRERFSETLLEAQLIEARMNHELVVSHHSAIPADQYYAEMFKAQGTTREQFQRSFTYYSGRPEEMKAIYEGILDELSRRKDDLVQ
ncbi:MAG: DUF4296 domain-containing protein [Flavobacteriales bacterium]|nr:DUF4296 domain-containing protein [Flavobacteriales bacterium]